MIDQANKEFYKQLQKVIDLPDIDSVRKLVITMEIGSLPEVELDMLAKEGTGEALTKSFKLIDVDAIEKNAEIIRNATDPMLKSIRDTLIAYKNG